MENKYFSQYSGKEYDLNNFKPKASLEDIVIATLCNQQDESECEADFGYTYSIYWKNNTIYIDYCQINETNESYYGNTRHIETSVYSRNIFKIEDVDVVDFINIIVDYERYIEEYIFCFGNKRMYKLHFQIDEDAEEILKEKNEELANLLLRVLIKYRI